MVAVDLQRTRAAAVAKRLLSMTKACQYTGAGPMRGAMTFNPNEYEVYGFHQGEVLGAWAWYKKFRTLIEES